MLCTARSVLPAVCTLAFLLVPVAESDGSAAETAGRIVTLARPVASGAIANWSDGTAVVFRERIDLPPETPSLRVIFSSAHVAPGGFIRITSLLDGDYQTLNGEHLVQWRNSSAYFNGSSVLIELVAAPHSTDNYLRIDKVLVLDTDSDEDMPLAPEELCGPDNRNRAYDGVVGRLLDAKLIPCTAFMIDRPTSGIDRCFLTAGHCLIRKGTCSFDSTLVPLILQLMVPELSGGNTVAGPVSRYSCSMRHPPCAKQFCVAESTVRGCDSLGTGADFAVFRCHPNPVTGRTPYQEKLITDQDNPKTLADPIPTTPLTLRVTGYGADGGSVCECYYPNGTRNHVLQDGVTDSAETVICTGPSGLRAIRHKVDTCEGNSGSPILNRANGTVIGIHTSGGCPALGYNYGTPIDYGPLVTAITEVSGMPIPDPKHCCVKTPAVSPVGLALLSLALAAIAALYVTRRRPSSESANPVPRA